MKIWSFLSHFGSGCSLHPSKHRQEFWGVLTSFPNKKVLWRSWCSPCVKPLPFLWPFNSCQNTRAEFQKSTSFSASSSFPVANRNPCLIPHVCLSYGLNLVIHRSNRVRETWAFKQNPSKRAFAEELSCCNWSTCIMTSHNTAALEVIQQCLILVQAWEETALRARQPDREAPHCKSSQRVIKVTLSILQRRKCLKGKAATAWLHLPLTHYAATRAGYNIYCCS